MTQALATTPADLILPPQGARGFSLVELVVSMGIMSLLLVGISSALIIASKAVPATNSKTAVQAQVAAAMDTFSADLLCATTITEFTATAITLTVADRGHGSVGPETIRYAWSGKQGDPLTRQYNGAAAVTIAPRVTAFALSPEVVAGQLTAPPRVLVFVTALLPSGDDQVRQNKLAAWSFPVSLIASTATQAQLEAAMASCDVVYVPEGVFGLSITTLFNNPSVGIVNESDGFYSQIGFSTSMTVDTNSKVILTDNTHPITVGLSLGNASLVSSGKIDLHMASGTLAPGRQTLATQQGGGTNAPALSLIECGGVLSNGQAARARRVALPWGGTLLNPMSPSGLTADAMTILKRSLVWAAAPPVYRSVGVSLTAGSAPAASGRVEFVNKPRVPIP